jgi:hypothetical protein
MLKIRFADELIREKTRSRIFVESWTYMRLRELKNVCKGVGRVLVHSHFLHKKIFMNFVFVAITVSKATL